VHLVVALLTECHAIIWIVSQLRIFLTLFDVVDDIALHILAEALAELALISVPPPY
jgi:hypothetical protein